MASSAGPGEAASTSGKHVTITWESWKPDQVDGAMLVKEFEAANPNITVNYKFLNYPDYTAKLRSQAQASDAPTVIGMQAGASINQYKDLLADLTPMAKAQWGANWTNRFYAVGLAPENIGGQYLGLPFDNLVGGQVWYNQALFQKAGIASPPTTLAEMQSDVKKLAGAGVKYPFVQGNADEWILQDMYLDIANQVAPGEEAAADAGTGKWNTPGLIAAAQDFKDASSIFQPGSVGIHQYPDAATDFYKQQAAMTIEGSWENDLMTTAGTAFLKGYIGQGQQGGPFFPFPFPQVPNAKVAPSDALIAGPDAVWSINKYASTDEKAAGWKLEAFLEGDVGQKYVAGLFSPPGVKGYPFDYTKVLNDQAKTILQTELNTLNSAKNKRQIESPSVTDAMGTALQKLITNQASAEAAMNEIQAAQGQG